MIRATLAALLLSISLACATPPSPEDWVRRGETSLAVGNADEASLAFRMALASEATNGRAQVGLARARRAQGDFEGALRRVEELLAAGGADGPMLGEGERCAIWLDAVRSRSRAGGPASALELLSGRVGEGCRDVPERAATAAALELRSRLRLAEAAERAGNAGEALAHFERAATLKPQSVRAQLGRVRALLAEGRRGEAIDALSEALRVRPRSRRLQDRMVDLLSH